MKSVAFRLSPKIIHAFGQLLIETMSPRTFKNCPIWSHCFDEGERETVNEIKLAKAQKDIWWGRHKDRQTEEIKTRLSLTTYQTERQKETKETEAILSSTTYQK